MCDMMSSVCEPFPVITHISCHPVNHDCVKDTPVALFRLGARKEWAHVHLVECVLGQFSSSGPDQLRTIQARMSYANEESSFDLATDGEIVKWDPNIVRSSVKARLSCFVFVFFTLSDIDYNELVII